MSFVFGFHTHNPELNKLVEEMVPIAKSSWFGTGKKGDGVATESAENVAKRIMDTIESNQDKYAQLFAEIMKRHYFTMPASATGSAPGSELRLDDLLFQALREILSHKFKRTLYNGSDASQAQFDLYTNDRAEVKAHKIALDLTQRILKAKRTDFAAKVETKFRLLCSASPHGPELTHSPLERDRLDLLGRARPLLNSERSLVLERASRLFEKKVVECAVVDSDEKVEVSITESTWEKILGTCASLQEPIAGLLHLGTTSKRLSSRIDPRSGSTIAVASIEPPAWKELYSTVTTVADRLRLRSVTLKILDPFLTLIRTHRAEQFDDFVSLDRLLREGEGKAEAFWASMAATPTTPGRSRQRDLLLFKEDLRAYLGETSFFALPEDLMGKLELFAREKRPAKRAQQAQELAPLMFLQSLNAARLMMEGPLARMDRFLEGSATGRPTSLVTKRDESTLPDSKASGEVAARGGAGGPPAPRSPRAGAGGPPSP